MGPAIAIYLIKVAFLTASIGLIRHVSSYIKNSHAYSDLYLVGDDIRKRCYYPSFVLAMAGPWLCVMGAVYHESAIIQPLTEYIWLGALLDCNRLRFLSRLFESLKQVIVALGEYYESIGKRSKDTEFRHPAGYLFINNFGLDGKFPYEKKLKDNSYVYLAKLDGSDSTVIISSHLGIIRRRIVSWQRAVSLHGLSIQV